MTPRRSAASTARSLGAETAARIGRAGDRRLLDELEARPARDQDDPPVERQRAGQRLAPDQLVERVVAADVLAQGEQPAVGVEQARGVEPAGGLEHGLRLAQPVRQRHEDRGRDDRASRDRRAADLDLVERRLAADPARGRGDEVALRDPRGVERAVEVDGDLVVGARGRRGVGEGHVEDPRALEEPLRDQEPDRELRLVTRGAHRDRDVGRRLPGPAGADRHGLLAGQPVLARLDRPAADRDDLDARRLPLERREGGVTGLAIGRHRRATVPRDTPG